IIYNLGTDWQVFSEYVMFTRPVKNMGRLSSEGHQLAVGLIRQGAENSFHVAIIENFLTYATTPDIGFYIAVDNRL
ncbi:MAG: hypothetical protein KDK34_02040, partial [Leptospiraceae bacterium]|nr:hypothetical protein [Leptospiraceae bacterium]